MEYNQMEDTVDPLSVYLATSAHKLTRVQSLKLESRSEIRHFDRQTSSQSTFSVRSLSSLGDRFSNGVNNIGTILKDSSVAFKDSSARRISESKKILENGMVCIRHISTDEYWFGEEACSEARAFVDTKPEKFVYPTIEEEFFDPRYPGAHLALPERKKPSEESLVTEPKSEPVSPVRSIQENGDFTEFAKIVYRRLKIYRGIYIFYSIIAFMLGLPVMVTGFKKQFFSGDEYKILDCPHYLGIISILSCCISLWTALKNQIVICVLTLLTGIVTVISAMIVLVTSALDLSAKPLTEISSITNAEKHLNQQTHVVFIFSIGLLIASLAIVITTMSHLSARRVKRGKSNTPMKVCLPKVEEELSREEAKAGTAGLLSPNTHRYSFASTISSLIKHELKDNNNKTPEAKEKLKKTLSCPAESQGGKNGTDLLGIVVQNDGPRQSTHSLPVDGTEYNEYILDRWRRASFLTKKYKNDTVTANANGEQNLNAKTCLSQGDLAASDTDIHAHESSV